MLKRATLLIALILVPILLSSNVFALTFCDAEISEHIALTHVFSRADYSSRYDTATGIVVKKGERENVVHMVHTSRMIFENINPYIDRHIFKSYMQHRALNIDGISVLEILSISLIDNSYDRFDYRVNDEEKTRSAIMICYKKYF